MEQETNRRDANDLSSNMAALQQAQQEILSKLTQLQSALDRATLELKETKASQNHQQNYITGMVTFLEQRFGHIGKERWVLCYFYLFLRSKHCALPLHRFSGSAGVH